MDATRLDGGGDAGLAPSAHRPSTTSPAGSGRWHDLDALRGAAMLLGIVLHASMSFFPGFWVVEDSTATEDGGWFDELFHAIHGFRMPLFFLLSGFFTAMLWRRRGLAALVAHRARRIALPLAIGMVTIVPAVNWSIEWAIDNGVDDYLDESEDIWGAVFLREERAVEELLDRGVDVDAPNPAEGGDTPLHVSAFVGDAAIAELLLDRGADPDARSDGGTPVEYAVFVGSEEVADLLVARGATDPRPIGGGWDAIAYWATGADLAAEAEAKFALESWLASFHHLWFLWFLLWLGAGFALVALAADRWARPSPDRAGTAGWVPVTLAILVIGSFALQTRMGGGGELRAFGPDTSTEIVPEWHVLAYYACFFAAGALVFGRRGRGGRPLVVMIGRGWPVAVPLACVVLPLALHVTLHTDRSWTLAAGLQTAYAWLVIIGLLGAFHTALATERRGVRYLSDSTYWLYLAHLPLVIVAQSAIRNWDLPAGVKFVGLTAVVTGVLLVSYQLFVRYTPIGTLLNGRRERPVRAPVGREPALVQEDAS